MPIEDTLSFIIMKYFLYLYLTSHGICTVKRSTQHENIREDANLTVIKDLAMEPLKKSHWVAVTKTPEVPGVLNYERLIQMYSLYLY